MTVQNIPFTLFEAFEIDTKKKTARKRSLRFTLNALADFEQAVGMGFGQLMSMKASFATTRAMCWAGLKHQDPGLTLERVGDLIGEYVQGGGELMAVLEECVEAAMEQGALGRPKTPDAPTDEAPALPAAPEPLQDADASLTLVTNAVTGG